MNDPSNTRAKGITPQASVVGDGMCAVPAEDGRLVAVTDAGRSTARALDCRVVEP